jgi:energy-coupling factor transporter ATP-binding protein EcfA2
MRLVRVEVKKLFGLFDHAIDLRTDERITIIFGPNGIGKTVILRLIDDLFGGRYELFQKIPFEVFALYFENDIAVSIQAIETPQAGDLVRRQLKITQRNGNQKIAEQDITAVPLTSVKALALADQIDSSIPLARTGPTEWKDPSGTTLSLIDVVALYGPFVERPDISLASVSEEKWLIELRRQFPPVRLIQTQRLSLNEDTPERVGRRLRPHPSASLPTVARYSQDLVERIKSILAQYGTRSQELDRSFPSRLISQGPTKASVPAEELGRTLADLEAKRSRLVRLGLIDQEPYMTQPPAEALRDRTEVLTIYASDVEQKLSTFDQLADRIDLFTSTINGRFQYKNLTIDRQRGFIFTQSTGAALAPSDLSSGEQHELVLLYDLLFRLRPSSLVLIDEPEISLHVGWQQSFLPDLKQVVGLSDIDVVVATHSPEIIGDSHRLAVMLSAPNDAQR